MTPWEEAFEVWNRRDDAGEVDLHHSPPAFRAGYVAALSVWQAERAEMVAALTPFAKLEWPFFGVKDIVMRCPGELTVGDFRRARALVGREGE